MDISIILEHLNELHQSALQRNEIQNYNDDLKSLINESSKKGLLRCISKGNTQCPEYSQNGYISKLNNLLPKVSSNQNLNIFSLIAKHADEYKLSINLPKTLIKLDGQNQDVMIYTRRDKTVFVKPSCEADFFNNSSKKLEGNCPLFCYKVPGKDIMNLFSQEDAEKV